MMRLTFQSYLDTRKSSTSEFPRSRRQLDRAQEAGEARAGLDGTDLFALIAGLAWLGDQPALAARAGHLFDVVARPALVAEPVVSPSGGAGDGG